MLISTFYFFLSPGNMSTVVKETRTKFQVIIFLIYFGHAILFLVSLLGNSVIIHIIRTNSSMKTTINHLILNQACADLLISLLEFMNAVHYNSYSRLWFGGLMGAITCKIFLTSLFVLPYFSIWILVVISVDRFYAVTRPLQGSPISRHLKKVILMLWTWSLFSSTSFFLHASVEKRNGTTTYCDTEIPLHTWAQFNAFALAFNVFLPLLVIAILYIIICVKLWLREVPGEGTSQNQRQAEAIETARKVTRMMIAVVVLFLLCWLPFLVTMALRLSGFVEYKALLFPIWLTVAYSGLNPYVYFAFSANFRNAAKRSFGDIRVLPFRSRSIELQQV